MPALHRFAIFLLVDTPDASRIRREQALVRDAIMPTSLALRLPVHVTMRGPFWATDAVAMKLFSRCVREVRKGVWPAVVRLEGAQWLHSRLLWRPVARDAAIAQLHRMHCRVDRLVRAVLVGDDVPARFQGLGYRPHVTLAWTLTGETGELDTGRLAPQRQVSLGTLALARYPTGWPMAGCVRVVARERLVHAPAHDTRKHPHTVARARAHA